MANARPPSFSPDPTRPGRTGGRGRRTGELGDGTANRKPDARNADFREAFMSRMIDPLWEMQPGESRRAYNAFMHYRNMGPVQRGQKALQKYLVEAGEYATENSAMVAISDMSAKYAWVERSRAYDAWLDTIYLAAQEKEIRAAAGVWVTRASTIRDLEYKIAMGIANKLQDMLNWPISRTTRRKTSRDGKTIYLTIIEPARWDFKAVGDLLARFGYQARLAAELPTDGAKAPTPEPTGRNASDVDAWLSELGATGSIASDVPIE